MPDDHDILRALLRIPVSDPLDVEGDRILIGSNATGTRQLSLLRLGDGAGAPLRLTDQPEPVSGRLIPGSASVLVTMDHGGDERHQLYLLHSPLGALEPLVIDHDHIHRIGGVSRDGSLLSYATNRRNGVDFDVVVRDLRDGAERVVFDRGGWCDALGFSPDGRWVALSRDSAERSMDNDILLCEVSSGEVVHLTPHDDASTFSEPAWLDASTLLLTSDVGRDTMAVFRWSRGDTELQQVLDSAWECACFVDDSGTRVLLAHNEDGRTRLELRDGATLPLPEDGVAWDPGYISPPRFAQGGRSLIFGFTSPREPGDVWSLDVESLALRRLTSAPREVPAGACVTPSSHRIPSFDGEQVPAFLYRPSGQHSAAPPVVVLVHGGPESQSVLMWNPVIQAMVARGYAVVVPNVRGSTGYGKRWCHLDDVRLRLDSVRDLAAIHAWLPSVGLDQRRAALYGGSYGGYMVLAGLTMQPELWAAGVDIVGMSSLVTFLENTSEWRRAVREREYGRLDRDRDFLVEASPLTHVDRIRAPLFILHGANDPRVPLSEAQQIHAVLQGKGVHSELLVYGDEGHGLARLGNRLDAYPRILQFLDLVLKG